jgi:tripartite-type tricarboxylate transporter receptor subunit TctC
VALDVDLVTLRLSVPLAEALNTTRVIVGSLPPLVPLFQNGKLRPLAATTEKRWHPVPDLPAVGTEPARAIDEHRTPVLC